MGPSKPGKAQELEDWAAVKNADAVALCYDLERFDPAEKDGKFFAEADKLLAPFARGRFDLALSLKAAGLDYGKMLKPLV